MNLFTKIKADLLAARKCRNTPTSRLLATLVGECAKVGYTVEGVRPVTDMECVKVVKKMIKNLNELANSKESRGDDVTADKDELKLLLRYMPTQLDVDQLNTIIEELVFTSGLRKIGVIMQTLKSGYDGQYDPRSASAIANDILKIQGCDNV